MKIQNNGCISYVWMVVYLYNFSTIKIIFEHKGIITLNKVLEII